MKIAEAFVELRVDGKRAQIDAETAARSAAQSAAGMFAQFFTAKVAIDGFVALKDAASDLQQAIGGTEVTFGEAAATIDSFAQTSAQAMGLSEAAFRSLTSQVGGLLVNLGFTQEEAANTSAELAQVGADLSAAYGGTAREAVEALGSALRGEFDSVERWNVSLRQSTVNAKAVEMGLAETTSSVDANARAQATLALITEQSANVAGHFASEQDTAAGKAATLSANLEDQRAKIGMQLLPIYVKVLELVGFLAGAFSELPAPIQAGIVAMLGIAAVAVPIANVVKALGGMREALTKIGTTSRTAATGVGVLTAALLLLSFEPTRNALTLFAGKVGETEAEVAELVTQLVAAGDPIAGFSAALVNTLSTASASGDAAMVTLSSALQGIGMTVPDLIARFEEFGTAYDANFVAALLAGLPAAAQTAEAEDQIRFAVGNTAYAYDQLNAAIAARDALDPAGSEEKLATATGLTAEAYEEAARAAAAYSDADIAARDGAQQKLDEWNEAAHAAYAADQERIDGAIAKRGEEIDAWQAWRDSINAAFSSGRSAVSDFTDEAMADLDLWQEELANDIMAIALWQDNIARIGAETSPEFAAFLAEMGLAGAGLVDDMAKNGAELDESFGLWEEATRQAGRNMVAEIEGIAADAAREGNAIGAALAQGMAAGIDANAAYVGQRAAAAARAAAVAAKTAMGIASPSRIGAAEVGPALPQGLASALDDDEPEHPAAEDREPAVAGTSTS